MNIRSADDDKVYKRFERGTFSAQPHHAWLWASATQSPVINSVPAGLELVIASRGSVAKIDDLFEALHAKPADTLFGELEFEFFDTIEVGSEFNVDTSIISVERKHGERSGPFDLAVIEYMISRSSDQSPVTEIRQTWVVKRNVDA